MFRLTFNKVEKNEPDEAAEIHEADELINIMSDHTNIMSKNIDNDVDSYTANDETSQNLEPVCKYCKRRSGHNHKNCLKECKTGEKGKLCRYCGLRHDKTIKCETYMNYGVKKIFISMCEFCSEPIHPDYGEPGSGYHYICKKEQKRRENENLCEYCCIELIDPQDINWGVHNDCFRNMRTGYKSPDQKMDLKIGYYPKSMFNVVKKHKHVTMKNVSDDKRISEFADSVEKIEIHTANSVQESICSYCHKVIVTEDSIDSVHDACIKEYRFRDKNSLCVYCGENHSSGKKKCSKTYKNYGKPLEHILICEYCNCYINPKLNEYSQYHDECEEEYQKRLNNNMCIYCGEVIIDKVINKYMFHGKCHDDGQKYEGYYAKDQKLNEKSETVIDNMSEDSMRESKNAVDEIKQINYNDVVGGLDKEIKKLREIIELPLMRPDLFKSAGISTPKGVLLYGPSGTGKTLLAKTMADQYGLHFTYVSAPSLQNKYVGVTERLIREMFENAIANAPSIIFIDEVDSIGKDRSNVDRMYQKDETDQILTAMDDLANNQVVVIGATNHPDMLDPAFRRPGRFDVEIKIGLPDENGRHNILKIHTERMPLNGVNLKRLAKLTHGFTGADIVALATAAGMSSIRGVVQMPQNKNNKIEITKTDFENALKTIKPSTLRSTDKTVTDVKWDDIGGLDSIKSTIMEDVEWPVKYSQEYIHMGIKPSKGILLHGPPGTGKTMIAKAIANSTESNFITVDCSELISDRPGKTEKNIKNVFEKARTTKPCVLFLDEIDSLLPERTIDVNNNRIVTQILLELDGAVQSDGVILIGATNMPRLIDKAALRPGRFDKVIKVEPPNSVGRENIIKTYVDKKPHDMINCKHLADITDGFTGADIAYVVNTAASSALRRHIRKGTGNVKNLKLVQRDVEDAITKIKQKRQII